MMAKFQNKLKYKDSAMNLPSGFAYDGNDRMVFTGHTSEVYEAVRRWNAFDGLVEALRTVEHEPISMGEASYEYMLLRVAGVARSALEAAKDTE